MKENVRIYWVKQKITGILVMLMTLIFSPLLIANDGGLLVVVGLAIGFLLIICKRRIFYTSDYIVEIEPGFMKRLMK